jgi:hypothetical protein
VQAAEAFFHWGEVALQDEIQEDVLSGLAQPKRSLLYNRSYGAGVSEYENAPVSLVSLVTLRLEVQKFFAARNKVVTSGQPYSGRQYPDRRAATSQVLVNVVDEGGGNLFVDVPYVILSDMAGAKQAKVPVGAG